MLAMAVGLRTSMLDGLASSRAGSLLQGCGCTQALRTTEIHCRSKLARDGGGSADIDVGWAGLIASRLAPTGVVGVRKICGQRKSTVGASLLAMAVGLRTSMLDGLASSRAGSLQQGRGVGSEVDVLGRDHVDSRHRSTQVRQVLVVFGDDVFGGEIAVVDGRMRVGRQHHVVA